MAKKKINGLSVAIVALNIVIVGIVILLVVLVYLHMKEDIDNGRPETTTPTASESQTVSEPDSQSEPESSQPADGSSEVTSTEDDTTEENTPPTVLPPVPTYNRGYFDNDLFIGDSISTGLYLYSYVDKDNVFAEVGLNPESAIYHQIDGVTSVQKVSAMQPRNIYIMLGTNGLAFYEGSYMANKMVELIAELEVACPTASIYIITIPPVTAAHEADGNETMALVNTYNAQLKQICETGGYGCIDLCSVLQDENGYLSDKYAEADGLHFLGDAYIAMLSYIQQYTSR